MIADLLAFRFVFQSSRTEGVEDVLSYIPLLYKAIWDLTKTTFELLPRYCFLVIVGLMLLASLCHVFANGRNLAWMGHVLVILLAAFIFPFATVIQGSGWFATRIIYPFASLPAVLALNLCVNQNTCENARQIFTKVGKGMTIASICILLIGQYFSFGKVFIDKYKVNIADEARCGAIVQAIIEYQYESGIPVTKIAVYQDAQSNARPYSNLYRTGDLTVSSFRAEWSDVNAINYYCGTTFERVDQKEEYTQYFQEKDWDIFSKEQLVFEGDTLHMCVY